MNEDFSDFFVGLLGNHANQEVWLDGSFRFSVTDDADLGDYLAVMEDSQRVLEVTDDPALAVCRALSRPKDGLIIGLIMSRYDVCGGRLVLRDVEQDHLAEFIEINQVEAAST